MRTIRSNGLERRYLLHVPIDIATCPDLVIALHALGTNPSIMEFMTKLSSKADEHGFIVIYPEGTISSTGMASWNAEFCCGDSALEKVDDVLFISDLIDILRENHNINNVLVTGFSNGGMLTHILGVKLSEKIQMIAPVGATISDEILNLNPERLMEVLIIHGQEDQIIPLYKSKGNSLPAIEAEQYWARVNKCDIIEKNETPEAIFHNYENSHKVTSIIVKNAGHVWPGGQSRMLEQHDPKTIDATSQILDRFLSQN